MSTEPNCGILPEHWQPPAPTLAQVQAHLEDSRRGLWLYRYPVIDS